MNVKSPEGLSDSEKDVWYRAFQAGYSLGRTDMLHDFQQWAKHEEKHK